MKNRSPRLETLERPKLRPQYERTHNHQMDLTHRDLSRAARVHAQRMFLFKRKNMAQGLLHQASQLLRILPHVQVLAHRVLRNTKDYIRGLCLAVREHHIPVKRWKRGGFIVAGLPSFYMYNHQWCFTAPSCHLLEPTQQKYQSPD